MKAFSVLLMLVLLIASWTVLREPSSPNVATDESLSPKVETGEVLGIRHVTLKEGVDSDEFERFFVEEYQPVFNERFPGLQFMLLKGDRGQDVGGYIFVLKVSSVWARNYYWPDDDSDSGKYEELLEACGSTCERLFDKFIGYVVEDVYSQYTDYVELTR